MENLFILICVAADDTKSKTDRQREREANKRQKTPPLSGCAHCGTVGWAQHRKRANKLYISNFMNSCWNGKRNGSREGRENEIGRGRQGTVARIDQFTNSTLNVQSQKQKHKQTTARVQFTTKNNNRRSSRGRGRDSSSSASDGA